MDKPAINLFQEILADTKILSYGKNQILIHADDIPSGVFFIKSGLVKKTAPLENGREITLRLYEKGSFFPLIWAFTNIDNFYYQTVTPVQLQKISKDKFLSFVRSHPDILFELTRQILSSENELFTKIAYELSGNSYHRVVAALLLASQKLSHNSDLPFTHQEIADITGLTRETVSLVILKLKKKKIISTRNHAITIKNFPALLEESALSPLDLPASFPATLRPIGKLTEFLPKPAISI